MNVLAKHGSFACLVVSVCMIGGTKAHGQSPEDPRKRTFAEVLHRRAKTAHAESGGAAANALKRRTVLTTNAGRSTSTLPRIALTTSPLFARVASTDASITGIAAATPVHPNGAAVHKFTFIQSLYTQILGREPSQSEVDHWTRLLQQGLAPDVVAMRLYNSPEHKSLVQNGTAPGIPWPKAYHNAYGAAHPGKEVPWSNR